MNFSLFRHTVATLMAVGIGIVPLAANASQAADLRQRFLALEATDTQLGRYVSQLLSNIEQGQQGQIMQLTIQALFEVAPDGQMSQADLDLFQKRLAATARARYLNEYLPYDLDWDGGISAVEAEGLVGREASKLAGLFALADTDGDGDVSADELRKAAITQTDQQATRLQGRDRSYLMAFDLDGDGVVVVNEVIRGIRILSGEDVAETVPARAEAQGQAQAQQQPSSDGEKPKDTNGLPAELHMVGIYEPGETRSSNGLVQRRDVRVVVDRPGVAVSLVLGSYEPTRWVIETSEGTVVSQVVAHDRNRVRGEVILNGQKISVTFRDLPLAYQAVGNRFQPFHDAAAKAAKAPKASSFHGAYTAPDEGFVIDDAPGVPTREEVNAALTAQALPASDLSPKLRDAFEGKSLLPGALWELRDEGFVGRDDKGQPVMHRLPLDLPEVSWPMGAAYDPERQVLWGVTLGGVGYLYEYDIANDQWAARSMDNVDAGGLIFDPATGNLIALPGRHGGHAYRVLNRDGKVLSAIEIPSTKYPGLIKLFDPGNGPAPSFVPVMLDGDQLLMRAEARHPGSMQANNSFVYLVDLSSGEVRLVR